MKRPLPYLLLLLTLASLAGPGRVLAQTPTLEFNSTSGTTANGPSVTDLPMTFVNNTDNPSGTTFAAYTPTLTATFKIASNSQYATAYVPTTGTCTSFGTANSPANTTSAYAVGVPQTQLMNGQSAIGNNNSYFTSAAGVSGGIAITQNYAVRVYTSAMGIPQTSSTAPADRYYFGDLTITFNRPVSNPILHLVGLGGLSNNNLGFTTDLDLSQVNGLSQLNGVTLSRLSGSQEFAVSASKIYNSNTTAITATTNSGAASGSALVSTSAPITSLTFQLYVHGDGSVANQWYANNNSHSGDGFLVSASLLTPSITGYVFTDPNYGGGAGRSLATANGVVQSGARVELYDASGTFVSATTTDANGQYTFSGLATSASAATYTVRVVNSTVTSSRPGYAAGLLPVQTYNGTTTRVGGENPAKVDAGNGASGTTLTSLNTGTTIAQSQGAVTIPANSTATTTGPDFGFNFDLIVNKNDAGQGSLRQFVLNSNALGGETALAQSGFYSNAGTATALPSGRETSIFMIPDGAAHPGLLASGNGGPASQLTSQNGQLVAVINLTTATSVTVTGANGTLTNLDGTTQTYNIGNTNTTVLGTGGTVGTAATTLAQVNGPEVQLTGNRGVDGLTVASTNVVVRGLALYGFVNNVNVNNTATGVRIEQNVLGTAASSFSDTGTSTNGTPNNGTRSTYCGIYLGSSDSGTITNNLVGFNGGMGIWVVGGANTNSITGNEIRGNALEVNVGGQGYVFDGIELQGASTGNTVSGNLITGNSGHGIDSYNNDGTGGNTITGNTISNNGTGVARSQALLGNTTAGEGSGLRVYGNTNLTNIAGNVISGNNGSGVLVENAANLVTISQNSIFNNAKLGIDLLNGNDAVANGNVGATGVQVTINDNGDGDTGGNGLLNFPVITSATVVGSNLVVTGYARPGSIIELFNPGTPDASGFGEGQTYLGTVTEGATTGIVDSNAGTGTYGPGNVNGLNQGTDNTNAFTFTIPLTGNFAGIAAGTSVLSATATLGQSTSEFSGDVPVTTQLTGYVFTDPNYGGGAGRPRSTSGTSSRPNATVELYDNAGAFVATTTTDANGQYTFNTTPGTYTVRVVNSTVTSPRPGYVAGLLPVQTYNGTTTRVGGENPAATDAAANTGAQTLTGLNVAASGTTPAQTAESIATVTTGTAATTGPDFGYNFDTVVNTNDAGQGSLRQFVLNSNALGGDASLAQAGNTRLTTSTTNTALPAGRETSIFMIPDGAAHPGLLASGNGGPASQLTSQNGQQVAVINLASAMNVTGANATLTSIDGGTQTVNIGNTNNATLNTGGSVGTANNPTSLSFTTNGFNGPEVQLTGVYTGTSPGGTKPSAAVNVLADNFWLRNVAVRNFGAAGGTDASVSVGNVPGRTGTLSGYTDATAQPQGAVGVVIENSVFGTDASSFAAPSPFLSNEGANGRNSQHIAYQASGTSLSTKTLTVRTNLLGYSERRGVHFVGNSALTAGYNLNTSIYDNVFQENGVGLTSAGASPGPYQNSSAGDVEMILTTTPFVEIYQNRMTGPSTIASFANVGDGGSDGIQINNAQVGSNGGNPYTGADTRSNRRDAGTAQAGSRIEQNSISNHRLAVLDQSNVAFASYALDGLTFTGNAFTGNNNGVYNQGASHTVQNNTFSTNLGRGFIDIGPSLTFTGNAFSNNGTDGLILGDLALAAATATKPAVTGVVVGTGNVFSNNGSTGAGAGVGIVNGDTRASLTQNSYFGNAGLAIDLSNSGSGRDGVTGNDGALNASFPNQGVDYPVLNTATLSGTSLALSGYVGSAAGQTAFANAKIEFFKADNSPANQDGPIVAGDGLSVAHGEGRTYLGTLTADANGNFSGTLTGVNGLATGEFVTATASIGSAATASTSEFGNNARVNEFPLTGYVFEDVNYGGGAGRPRTAGGAVVRPGAKVEIYDNTTGAFVAATVTNASGQYSVNVLPGTYTVRVVNSSVLSSRPGATAASGSATAGYVSNQLAVQTYNGTTTRVGGENPAYTDAAANTGAQTLGSLSNGTITPESIAPVTVGSAAQIGPDFGFNFDLIVNKNDAGQGSLRQFINNANALGGEGSLAQAGSNGAGALPAGVETSIFMIPNGTARPGLLASGIGGPASQLTGGVAVITPATALPALTGLYAPLTSLDGTTQTANIGNTNNVTLGTGGNVGASPTALGQLNGPEVQLVGTQGLAGTEYGLNLQANNLTVRGLAVYGFGNTGGGTGGTGNTGGANILVSTNAISGISITGNVLGTSASSFSDPGATARTTGYAILFDGNNGQALTTAYVAGNLIGFNGTGGVESRSNGNGNGTTTGAYSTATSTGIYIENNEIRGNAQFNTSGDGTSSAAGGSVVRNNLFASNAGPGVDILAGGTSNAIVYNNTLSGNGVGNAGGVGQTPAIRVNGSGNTISQNLVYDNYGAGVLVRPTASTTVISQNGIYNNGNVLAANGGAASGEVGIDLQASADNNPNAGNSPYVTLNSATTTGGNGLVNYPILRTATVVGNTLVVTGYAKAGATIELFIAQPNPAGINGTGTNFGQGKTYLATVTEGTNDADGSTGQSYGPGSINGFAQGSDTNANGFSFTIALPAGVAPGSILTATSTLSGATSEFSGNVTALAPLTGYVFEDVNYGGGAGRPRTAGGATGRSGATVELYDNTGAFVATTTTNASGQYSFNVPTGTGYTVRVVNNSVTSSRTGYVAGLLPVQTYAGLSTDANAVNRVGGQNPAYTDAGANTGSQTLTGLSAGTVTPESIATASVGTGATNAGPDFGYNFDVVVNVNDAGQGSLRQFIVNSNALGGETTLAPVYTAANGTTTALATGLETSIFMIPNGQAVAGQLAGLTNAAGGANFTAPNNGSGTAATIQLASTLPDVTGLLTAIDGRTQTRSTGNSNAAVTTLGTESTGPEVLINLNNNGALNLSGSDDQLVAMGVYNSVNSGVGVFIANSAQRVVLQENTINNNGANITFQGASSATPSAATIQNNIIRDSQRGTADGIELNGNNSNMTITSNQFLRNAAFGIDFISGSNSGNVITNNTFAYNGTLPGNSQRSGIGIRGGGSNNNLIQNNTFLNNSGPGIVIKSGSTGNRILQNSFAGNGYNPYTQSGNAYTAPTGLGLGIDLTAQEPSGSNYDVGDGPTLNDVGDSDGGTNGSTGANGLINFPIIQSAVVNANGTVTVNGFARPGVTVELYLAAADPTNFGEGQTFLTSFVQGTAPGTVGAVTTGAAAGYGPGTLNDGVAQGSDNTLTYSYTFTPTAAQLTALRASTALLTSTATLATADAIGNFGTSEFSGNARVFQAPVPNDATNVSIASNTVTPVTLSPSLSATTYGLTANVTTNVANSVAYYTVSLPSSGTLYYNNVPLTAANVATTQVTDLGQLKFTPTFGSTATVTFTYTATDANGLTSTQHSTGGTITNGPATYTIPVTAAADVTTVLSGPATLNAGQPSGTFTAVFTNNGPATATAVTQVVTLPAGATLSSTQQNDLTTRYPTTTFGTSPGGAVTITFPPAATLNPGASNTYTFAFTSPPTAGSPSLSSTVGTGTSQGANSAPDTATLPLTVQGVADVATVLSSTSGTSVAAGSTVTLSATYNNTNGNAAATGVTAQVQLPLGLSGVTTSGGSYSATTGIVTYNIGSIGAGAAATALTITYVQPATGSVTAVSSISTVTNEAGQVANNVSAVTVTPALTYDVLTTISGPTSAPQGSQVTYNVTTSNSGAAGIGTATNVAQTVTLPAGATNVYVTGGGTVSGTTVTFPAIASLAAGQRVNNTVSFTAPAGPFNTVANVTSTQDNVTTGNNTATVTTNTTAATAGTANLYTTITPSATNVAAGTAVTFTVAQGNYGPNLAASVVSTVMLPAGLPITGANAVKVNGNAPTSTTSTTATYAGGATYDSTTGLLTYNTTAIATQNSTATQPSYTVTVVAPASGVVTASASVSSSTPDPMMGNNVASAEVTVDPAATDLATTLSGPDQASAGQRVTYTAATVNNGPASASGIVQVVQIPAGLPLTGTNAVFVNGAAPTSTTTTTATYGDGSTYDATTGLVTFATTAAAQATGGGVSNSVTYTVPNNGNASTVHTARVRMAQNDTNPTNNVAVVVTTLQQVADVQVTLSGPASATPASATAGAPVTYGVTTTNNGPSVAGSVATTVQLPTGLSGVVVTGYDGAVLTNSATTGYNSADGVVRFPAVTAQPSGAASASSGTIAFVTPAGANVLALTATAALTPSTANPATEPNLTNNSATAVTTLNAPSTASVDLLVGITRSAATVTAGSPVSFTVTTTNAATSTASASAGAVTTVQLPAGLTSNGGTVTFSNGGSYDNATGLVTITSAAALAAGASTATTISISRAPGVGTLAATAAVRGNESDPVPANNTAATTVGITSAADVATTISGPTVAPTAGPVTYTVTTTNNGPSPATNVAQTVVLPAGIVSYSLNGGPAVVLNGGSATTGTTTVTLPVPATLPAGAANTVANTVSFAAPASPTANFPYTVTANLTATEDPATTGNNTAAVTTNRYVQPPVATFVTNTLQAPEGNTATTAMLISPLAATTATGTITSYALTSLPPSSQGTLYYNGTAAGNAATLSTVITNPAALYFLPANGFVGNASFTYTALANGLTSNVATYLIPVGQDNSSVSTASTQVKGNSNPYVNGDVLSYVIDPNGAQYTANSGTTPGLVYNAATGVLQTGAVNGLVSAVRPTGANSGPSQNPTNALPNGVSLDPVTGQIYVSEASQLPRVMTATTYYVNVVTTDVYGGVNTVTETFTLGAFPLPVELVAFTAQAVQNRDGLLKWTTASEKDNDHFDVERSLDGSSYVKIGQVQGQGSKASATNYDFTDASVAAKVVAGRPVYYRLRQVDLGGTSTYSPVRTVSFTGAAGATVGLYPNPAASATSLDLRLLPLGNQYQVLLLDATGRQVRQLTLAGGQVQELTLSDVASGTYQVLVTGQQPDGSALRQVLRLVKE